MAVFSRSHLACVLTFFFFNDTATTEIYTLSLHDALPISMGIARLLDVRSADEERLRGAVGSLAGWLKSLSRERSSSARSEEHTSELQSLTNLVCRLLLEKKKNRRPQHRSSRQWAASRARR